MAKFRTDPRFRAYHAQSLRRSREIESSSVDESNFLGWDISSLPGTVVASNNGFTLTKSSGAEGTRPVLHSLSKSEGAHAIRWLVRNDNIVQAPSVGFAYLFALGAYLGANANGYGIWPNDNSNLERCIHNGDVTSLGNLADFDVLTECMLELDLDNGLAWFGVDGTFDGNPAAGTGATYSGISGEVTIATDIYYRGEVQLLKPSEFITPATAGFQAGW